MLTFNKKQKNLITSLNFRIKSLSKKLFLTLRNFKTQNSLQLFFKIWRNQFEKTKIYEEKTKKIENVKNVQKFFSAWKNLILASKQNKFYFIQSDFFYTTNLKIATMKKIKLHWLMGKKIKQKADFFLKKWTLRTIFDLRKKKEKDKRKNQLVKLYYGKILMRRIFKNMVSYFKFLKFQMPELFLKSKYFHKLKEIAKSKGLQKDFEAKRVYELKTMKKCFRGIFIWKKIQKFKENREFKIKIHCLYLLRENYCIAAEKHSNLDFLLFEFLERNNKNQVFCVFCVL